MQYAFATMILALSGCATFEQAITVGPLARARAFSLDDARHTKIIVDNNPEAFNIVERVCLDQIIAGVEFLDRESVGAQGPLTELAKAKVLLHGATVRACTVALGPLP